MTLNRLPVFSFRVECGAVFFNDFRRIFDERLALQKGGDTLNVDLRGNKIRDGARKLLYRVGNNQSIVDEHGHFADGDVAEQHHVAALIQDHRDADGGQKADDRNIHGI